MYTVIFQYLQREPIVSIKNQMHTVGGMHKGVQPSEGNAQVSVKSKGISLTKSVTIAKTSLHSQAKEAST